MKKILLEDVSVKKNPKLTKIFCTKMCLFQKNPNKIIKNKNVLFK